MTDRLLALAARTLCPLERWHARRTRNYNATHHDRGAVTTRRTPR